MENSNASTMRTKEFLAHLAEGHFDGGGVAAVVSTSYADKVVEWAMPGNTFFATG